MSDPFNQVGDSFNPHQSFEEFQKERAGANIEDIHKALVLDIPIKKIPEQTFINEILPVITGQTTNADLPALVAGVAGNPFLEIDIIDQQGNILFRMPSLLERDIISQKEASKRGSMQSMLLTMGQLRGQSPARAANYMVHEFNNRGIATNKAELMSSRAARWTVILARYGMAYSGTDKAGKPTVALTAPAPDKKMEIDIDNGDLF